MTENKKNVRPENKGRERNEMIVERSLVFAKISIYLDVDDPEFCINFVLTVLHT